MTSLYQEYVDKEESNLPDTLLSTWRIKASQLIIFTCSKSTLETLENYVKFVQS